MVNVDGGGEAIDGFGTSILILDEVVGDDGLVDDDDHCFFGCIY